MRSPTKRPFWRALFALALFCCALSPAAGQTSTHAAAQAAGQRYDLPQMAEAIQQAINAERSERGLDSLIWNDTLAVVARAHSERMADADFFAHTDPDHGSPTERARERGYRCIRQFDERTFTGLSENILYLSAYHGIHHAIRGRDTTSTILWHDGQTLVQRIVDLWMNSPSHRRNILTEHLRYAGVGLYIDPRHRLYATHEFC